MTEAPAQPQPGPAPDEAEGLRRRATKCRTFAREYASDVGASLEELAIELDKAADRIDRAVRSASLGSQAAVD